MMSRTSVIHLLNTLKKWTIKEMWSLSTVVRAETLRLAVSRRVGREEGVR